MLFSAPCAGRGDVGDDGISAHGETADSFGLDAFLLKEFEYGVSREAATFGIQCGRAAIDVVIAGAAGGELELPELKAGAGEEREELFAVGSLGHQR